MRRIISVLAVVALAACANGTSENGTAPLQENSATVVDDLSTLERFCLAVGHAACSPAVVKGCGTQSADTCAKARADACNRDVPQGTTYIAANALACVQAIKTANDDATLTGDELTAIDKACGPPVFAGPGEARSQCTSPYDCRSDLGLDCLIPWDGSSTTGKCMKPHVVPMGQACSGDADVCAPDAYCEAASHTCKPRPIVGQPCSTGYAPCAPGSKCPGAGPFGQTCVALKVAGDPCKDAAECQSNLCDRAKGQSEGNCADQIIMTALDSECADFLTDSN